MNFNFEQLFIIGLVASALVYVIVLISQRTKWTPNREQLTIGLYVVSFALAVVFIPQTLPALPVYGSDPGAFSTALITYVGSLLAILSAYIGVATAIYNLLGKRVFDALTAKLLPTPPANPPTVGQ